MNVRKLQFLIKFLIFFYQYPFALLVENRDIFMNVRKHKNYMKKTKFISFSQDFMFLLFLFYLMSFSYIRKK